MQGTVLAGIWLQIKKLYFGFKYRGLILRFFFECFNKINRYAGCQSSFKIVFDLMFVQ